MDHEQERPVPQRTRLFIRSPYVVVLFFLVKSIADSHQQRFNSCVAARHQRLIDEDNHMRKLRHRRSLFRSKIQRSNLGGVCIVTCICVGAGMFAIPSAGAGIWTVGTSLILASAMLIMTLSGCLLLEIYQRYPYRSSFYSVTKDILGTHLSRINSFAVYFVGAILLYAYISSLGLLSQQLFDLSPKVGSILSVLGFSLFVWHSTKLVSRLSVLLIIAMLACFVLVISGLFPHIEFSQLSPNSEGYELRYAWVLIPISLASFGYHHAVSSLRDYYRNEKQVEKVLIFGTASALVIYLLWCIAIFGILPRHFFPEIILQGGNISALLMALETLLPSVEQLHALLTLFFVVAILSSFVGVGLGLFDFLADFFRFSNTTMGRLKTWSVTFLPPLAFSLILPFGFLGAISFAALVSAIWTCLFPPVLVFKLRKQTAEENDYRTPGSNIALIGVFVFGVSVIVINLLAVFELLPEFT